MPLAVTAIIGDRNTVINAQVADWQVQTQTKAEVRSEVLIGAPIIGIGIEEARVVKNRSAHVLDNREAKLTRYARHGLTAQRLTGLISRADVAKREAA